jgi:hypothetical protein
MKIAICIPCYGDTRAGFTLSLARMLEHTLTQPAAPETKTFIVRNSLMPGREQLVGEARRYGADFILWLDADHVFPPDTLLRLLSHGKDVVGCNYARRGHPTEPTSPTAGIRGADGAIVPLWTTPDAPLEEVARLGLGVCLMRLAVLDKLDAPLFWIEMEDGVLIGEDTRLFRNLEKAGFKTFVDHGLSWRIGHIDEQIRENVHTIADKARWKAMRRGKAGGGTE